MQPGIVLDVGKPDELDGVPGGHGRGDLRQIAAARAGLDRECLVARDVQRVVFRQRVRLPAGFDVRLAAQADQRGFPLTRLDAERRVAGVENDPAVVKIS